MPYAYKLYLKSYEENKNGTKFMSKRFQSTNFHDRNWNFIVNNYIVVSGWWIEDDDDDGDCD